MKYEVLLLLQLGGLFMAYNEYSELVNCSIPKLIARLFILFIPILLYINLLILNDSDIVF